MFLCIVEGRGAVYANAHTVIGLTEDPEKIEERAALPRFQIDLLLSFVDKFLHIFMLNCQAFNKLTARLAAQVSPCNFVRAEDKSGPAKLFYPPRHPQSSENSFIPID